MLFFTEEKVAKLLWEIKPTIFRETYDISTFKFVEADPAGAQRPDFDDSGWSEFRLMDYWGGYDRIAWFRARVVIPTHLRDKKLALRFLVGPRDGGDSTAETQLYVEGEPLQAIDVWHEEAWLPPEYANRESITIALRSWSSVLGVPDRRRFKVAQLNWIDEGAEGYYFLAENLLKAVKLLDEKDWRRVRLIEALNESTRRINFTKPRSDEYYRTLEDARRYLADCLSEFERIENPAYKPKVVGIGHSHIDLAWLWRWSHSREKAGRTFSTVLHLMRQYPEYRFMHSSPALYKALSEDYPDIFERVKAKIASGEWEITGGMWVEPDTNVPSGESLVRQLLYGRRYVRETFGKEMNVVWLPDVFGYSWALPQIMKKSGIDYFLTSKISWSQFNRFPHDTFRWRGIDGTEILTHFVTTPEEGSRIYTYNGTLQPGDILGIWNNYRSKRINDELILPFGWGDGGGGPTREMLESARVMKNLPGFPSVDIGHAEPYFKRLGERVADKDVPVWDGELYLEYHRGTYTSQAANKRNNRKTEILYHDAEFLSALADILLHENAYPDLREGWELILLNQFHDILPGSSIRQVYEDSAKDYARVMEIGQAAVDRAIGRIASNVKTDVDSLIVFNTLPWERDDLVEVPYVEAFAGKAFGQASSPVETQTIEADGGKKLLFRGGYAVPPLGYSRQPLIPNNTAAADKQVRIQPAEIDTPFYNIRLNANGQLTSVFAKGSNREILSGTGNVFQAFEDKPMAFDAWDIDLFYQEKMQIVDDLIESVVEETGPLRWTLRLKWHFYDSTITQRLSVYRHSRRIDFRTEIDWQEGQILLKVAFPVNIRATRATYDIQFGSIERPTHWNTSWDYARFEVPAHKYAELSEGDYGVALLNDCKYGYDIHDNVMRLTLLKSPIRPDAMADKGRHVFTYSLLPYDEDGLVLREAYQLNVPLRAVFAPPQPQGTLDIDYRMATSVDVMIETFKRAEDGDGWIVRVYEARQHRDQATLWFNEFIQNAVECNLVEEGESPVEIDKNVLRFHIKPFEIKTFRVWFV